MLLTLGKLAILGADDDRAARLQRLDVLLRSRMQPHAVVHRGRDQELAGEGEGALGHHVIGKAMREARDRVGTRRDDRHHPGGTGRVEVRVDRAVRIGVIRQDVPTAEARERRLTDEASRGFGHGDLHGNVGLDEAAHDLAGAIGRDAASDGQQDGRRPIRRGYDSVVSHAILSAAISSRAIVR